MKSKSFIKFFLLLLFFLSGFSCYAQKTVKYYKKSSTRENYQRRDVENCEKVVVAKQKKGGKVKEVKIDSLCYSQRVYRLGERVIMPGDSGKDVRSVAKILVNKIYIDESELVYTKDGGVVYKGRLVEALKHFQEFNGLRADGIIGREVVKLLRKRK